MVNFFTSLLETKANADIVQRYMFEEMKRFLDEINSSEYTVVSSGRRLAKVILFLADVGKPEVYSKAIEMVAEKLADCNKYAYASVERVEKCMAVLYYILDCVNSKELLMIVI